MQQRTVGRRGPQRLAQNAGPRLPRPGWDCRGK